ncbi:MAG: hypothetical protein Ctma_0901 [Catillopecten margaritatus gill symbiont]|uniref:Uncharacterized protein n=1 Tax=Catillopecten margaritatus gill symbiont TaxID=3083288 RepID=A0AAU6PGQ2_9GAMM
MSPLDMFGRKTYHYDNTHFKGVFFIIPNQIIGNQGEKNEYYN